MKRSLHSTFGAVALAAMFFTGCSQSMSPAHGGMASPASTSATPAASLRTGLNTLFAGAPLPGHRPRRSGAGWA